MREAISALEGASFDGLAKIADAGVSGMITLRGRFDSTAFAHAIKSTAGLTLPGQRQVTLAGGRSLLWMSPDELLLVCDYAEAPGLADALVAALGDEHALAVNVSDARARLTVSGARAHEVLGKLIPVDFSPAAFPEGSIRRSRMAQIPAAVWKSEPNQFEVVMFRSVAQYAFDALSAAAHPGSEVGLTG